MIISWEKIRAGESERRSHEQVHSSKEQKTVKLNEVQLNGIYIIQNSTAEGEYPPRSTINSYYDKVIIPSEEEQ